MGSRRELEQQNKVNRALEAVAQYETSAIRIICILEGKCRIGYRTVNIANNKCCTVSRNLRSLTHLSWIFKEVKLASPYYIFTYLSYNY